MYFLSTKTECIECNYSKKTKARVDRYTIIYNNCMPMLEQMPSGDTDIL